MERLTERTNVLSFDCGLSNLAYCLLEDVNTEKREFKIKMWENLSLNSLEITQAVENLVRELDSRPWMMLCDHVCIESQLHANTIMKALSHAIQTYFLTKAGAAKVNRSASVCLTSRTGPRVHFVSPQSKFKVTSIPEPPASGNGHNRNKRVAVAMAKKLLVQEKDITSLEYLESHKKQDDLSDSMLQGIIFLRMLRKKKRATSSIMNYLGVKDVVIMETGDKDIESRPFCYKSEDFVVPEFDIDGNSIQNSVTYKRN